MRVGQYWSNFNC